LLKVTKAKEARVFYGRSSLCRVECVENETSMVAVSHCFADTP